MLQVRCAKTPHEKVRAYPRGTDGQDKPLPDRPPPPLTRHDQTPSQTPHRPAVEPYHQRVRVRIGAPALEKVVEVKTADHRDVAGVVLRREVAVLEAGE